MTDQERFDRLLLGKHPCINIVTHDEAFALTLVREAVMKTALLLNVWSINGGVRDGLLAEHPAVPETEHAAAALYYLARQKGPAVHALLDLSGHLRDERTLRLLRDLIGRCRANGAQIVLIDYSESLPDVVRAESVAFDVSLPDDVEIERIVRDTLRRVHVAQQIKTEISRSEFHTIVNHLSGLSRRQIEQVIVETVAEDLRFDAADLNIILMRKRQMIHAGGLLQFVNAPQTLDEIGGLARLKRWLDVRAGAFTREAAEFGLCPPRGILLLGVQGAGKSFCAKAIATAWKRPLLRMDVGSLYNSYIGESERRLRDALKQAEMMSPVILWVDEIEKAFASAASRSTDGGLSQRMFGYLLTWMQEHRRPVFLVATANDIEALPPELLRKGRFDEVFFVDLPSENVRRDIFAIHLRKRRRDVAAFDLDALASASEGYTGAEIEQAVISALHVAFSARTEITTAHIKDALSQSPPLSVTQRERIAHLRQWANGRCTPAD